MYTCKLNKLECKHKCIVVTSPSSFPSFTFVTWLDIPLLIVHVVMTSSIVFWTPKNPRLCHLTKQSWPQKQRGVLHFTHCEWYSAFHCLPLCNIHSDILSTLVMWCSDSSKPDSDSSVLLSSSSWLLSKLGILYVAYTQGSC